MSVPITIQEVAARLNSFPHDNYLYIGGIMRSVAWAAGTIVLLKILLDFGKNWTRALPWIATLLATVVTVTTWGRGVLLTNSRASLGDVFLPILMGIAEFCLFAILFPKLNLEGQDDEPENALSPTNPVQPWHYWFFVQAAHALLAVGLVLNRIHNTDPLNDFDKTLQPLATEYMRWMWHDVLGASIGTVVFTGLGLLTLYFVRRGTKFPKRIFRYRVYCALLVLIPIFIFSMVINDANQQRVQTDAFVSEHMKPPCPADGVTNKDQH